MTEECNKYQALFIFTSKEVLDEHIKICPQCRKEHEQMENVARLVKEVKPYFKKSKHKVLTQLAACLIMALLSFFAIIKTNYTSYVALNNDNKEALALVKSESMATQMDLPTDEYGLINTETGNDES